MAVFENNTHITPPGCRPQVLILPYNAQGEVALLGSYFEDEKEYKWGFIQGGIDEHFARARKNLPLREQDFRTRAWKELSEETRIEDYLPKAITADNFELLSIQATAPTRAPRDGFEQKHFYTVGLLLPKQHLPLPRPENLRGYHHKIEWVHPWGFTNRLQERAFKPKADAARSALQYLLGKVEAEKTSKVYKSA